MWSFLLITTILYAERTAKMLYSESLKKRKDFQIVYKKGKSVANKNLVMYKMKNHIEGNRLGISVSKKVGNSVVRHRVTRLIRESYRLNEEKFEKGYDYVVIARAATKGMNYFDMERSLLHVKGLYDKKEDVKNEKNANRND